MFFAWYMGQYSPVYKTQYKFKILLISLKRGVINENISNSY